MAYGLPDLAVTGAVIPAAWGNAARDSIAESAPGKATTAGRIFYVVGTNEIDENDNISVNSDGRMTLGENLIFPTDATGVLATISASNRNVVRRNGTVLELGDNAGWTGILVRPSVTVTIPTATSPVLTAKITDVAHGMTDIAETDTFAALRQLGTVSGGAALWGFTESAVGVHLTSHYTNDVTTKLTSSDAALILEARKKSGTTVTAPGADANLLAIRANGVSQFLFDFEGQGHSRVAWTTFDEHHDVALLDALERELAPGVKRDAIRDAFGKVLRYNRAALQASGIVNFERRGSRYAFVNWTRLAMAHTGAIRQLHDAIEDRYARLAAELDQMRRHPALAGV